MMQNRPRELYTRTFKKDDPPTKDRRKFVPRLKQGGLKEYEPEVAPWLEGVSLNQPAVTSATDKDQMQWIYVGNFWWGRVRTKKEGKKKVWYEFSRIMAVIQVGKLTLQYDGLWNARRHQFKPSPVIVYKASDPRCRGYIVGNNEWEVWVEWEVGGTGRRSLPEPIRDIQKLVFEYYEDFNRYSKTFSKIQKSCLGG
jgi:hypothetical protein